MTDRQVEVRCYEELNDFLPPGLRKRPFPWPLQRGQTVKSLVESLGIPHTEVDLVLVNGRSVGFAHRLADGDRLSVYPVFESLDLSAVTRVRPRPLRQVRFVLDVHLGRLARLLRLAGFDSPVRQSVGRPHLEPPVAPGRQDPAHPRPGPAQALGGDPRLLRALPAPPRPARAR